MDSAIEVAFEVEKYDEDKFRVVRKSWRNNGYGVYDRKDETSEILLDGLDIHNATYICHVYNYFWRNKQIELTDEFLKEKEISPSALAYYYVKESLGSEWGIHNGHKLLGDFVVDLWLNGASFRFGILRFEGLNIKAVREELKDAIRKCLDCYGTRYAG